MNNKTQYPTKDEILSNPPEILKEEIYYFLDWKKENFIKKWSKTSTSEKTKTINNLIINLSKLKNKEIPNIEWGNYEDCYNPQTKTIFLNFHKISIITALHELGHHLFGESELKACSYSIWLWKTIFPIQYEKMKWENHLLKKVDLTTKVET